MANAPARSTHDGSVPPPLVGRDREQAALRVSLDHTLAGHGGLVLIGGEAGIGKTALAEWALAEATGHGALVLVGRCYDLAETPPYGPWRDLFARYPAGAASPPPAPFARRGALGAVASQQALFDAVGDWLAALAARRPLVVLLDDLHWADPASLDLLRVLARGLGALPVLLLVTNRADELTRRHPLYHLLPRLVHEARTTRLDLRALDEPAVRALVRARYALGDADERRLVTYLQGRAEGNPFFLGELLRALGEEGTLRPAGRGWALSDLYAAPVPALVRQVLDGRIDRLGEEARGRLAVAAVIGQEVPLPLWQRVTGLDEVALLPLIERAAEAHLLLSRPDGMAVRFAHALVHEALYEGAQPMRRRAWHRQIAELLAADPDPDPDAVAYHFQRAGDARAAEWLLRAGERAQAAYAWATAVARYEEALALADGDAPAEVRARLNFRLGGLLRFRDPRRGLAALDEAAHLAAAGANRALTARIQLYRGLVRSFLDEIPAGIALLREAGAALEALPAEARRGTIIVDGVDATNDVGTVVVRLAFAGYLTEAEALGGRVLAQEGAASATGRDGAPFADAYHGLGYVHAFAGRPGAARAAYARARQLNAAAGHTYMAGGVAFDLLQDVALVYEADDPAACAAAAAAAEAEWTTTGGEVRDFPARMAWLPILVVEGGWNEARALTVPAPAGMGKEIARFHAEIAAKQGDRAMAAALVAQQLPGGAATPPGAAVIRHALPIQRLAARLAVAARNLPAARRWLEAHDRWLAWSGAVLGQAEGHLGWAAYYRAANDLPQARQHAERALAHATDPRQPLALLAAHRLLGELATATGHHADAAQHLAAALALADACAAPYERALTLLATAELRAAAGQPAAAQALLAEVRAICTPLEAQPALARAAALAARLGPTTPAPAAYPAGLTAREVEVLRLVAQGQTNQEIAATLFLSFRTVERHLANVYSKIDAHGRADATAFAYRHHLL